MTVTLSKVILCKSNLVCSHVSQGAKICTALAIVANVIAASIHLNLAYENHLNIKQVLH
jgi:hypothetical protein